MVFPRMHFTQQIELIRNTIKNDNLDHAALHLKERQTDDQQVTSQGKLSKDTSSAN